MIASVTPSSIASRSPEDELVAIRATEAPRGAGIGRSEAVTSPLSRTVRPAAPPASGA